MIIEALSLLFFCFISASNASINDCKFTDTATGKTYDLSPLIARDYYSWNQTSYSIGGFSIDSLVADSKVNMSFQLQICRNVVQPKFTNCSGNGAIYSNDTVNGCISWGDSNVSVFSVNPYKDGINWRLYHGSTIDHTTNYAAIVYFVCNTNVTMDGPHFEHVKAATNQAHFKIFTKYAC